MAAFLHKKRPGLSHLFQCTERPSTVPPVPDEMCIRDRIQIAHLYVQILSNIETLQRSAENIALYKGASAVAEQEYRNRRTSIHDAVSYTHLDVYKRQL